MPPSSCCLFAAGLILSVPASAGERLTLVNVPAPPPLVADEPMAREFSLERAAQSLDTTALHWQKTRKCAACHTLPPYLIARHYLAAVAPEPPEVRRFFETIVEQRLEGEPNLLKDSVAAVVIEVAAALAFHDRATTGKLHPRTRQELDRMDKCKLLLDTDECPWCNEGKVTLAKPRCDKCGFEMDRERVLWG